MKFTVCDISTPGSYVNTDRGFIGVRNETSGEAQIPILDLAAVVVTGRGVTFSSGALSKLGEEGVPVVICGPKFLPSSVLWPTSSDHISSRRMRYQIAATKPKQKAAWKQIIKAKLMWQAETLKACGVSGEAVRRLAGKVRSGDPSNVEAQGARKYWTLLFGQDFKRHHSSGGINSALNYGYAVLRAAMARAVAATGVHPSVPIMHTNHHNPFGLVDDLMEVFRPTVDLAVWNLRDSIEGDDIGKSIRQVLAGTLHQPVNGMGNSILMNHVYGLAVAYAQYLEDGAKLEIIMPVRGANDGSSKQPSIKRLSGHVDARYV